MRLLTRTISVLSALLIAASAASAQQTGTSIGDRCPSFTQSAPDGTEVSLDDVIKENRYTLIDFWASWCTPCAMEVPYLSSSYAQYHDKGFEIIGVSLDFRKASWTQSIEDNGMAWIHVSDLEYWSNAVAVRYGIKSIPANFLVDSQGLIVATNLRGTALQLKLQELLD